ncbi:MAG: hypothetical protein HEQ40_02525 [Lacibacter sp.]|jgi:hypothetical protein
MKKILLVSFILATLTNIVVAQAPHQHIEQKLQGNATVETGYFFMENGKVLYIAGAMGMGSKIQNDMVLKNGTVIKSDGVYQLQDGTQLRLRNGQIMDVNGVKYKSERQFRKKNHMKKNKTPKMHSGGHQGMNMNGHH